jgi:acyl-coenzyme A synthetase/AMP-(fatty) acid ligase
VEGTPLRASPWVEQLPQIPFEQRVATVFTSGSTGAPQAHHKSFGRLQRCADAARKRLWAAAGGPCAVLGTVPFRHMYGLELTVLLPLLGGASLASRLPFYPADIAAALAELPAPRLLVTTPLHLRALLDAGLTLPPIATVLSATAPLSAELATRAEVELGAPVMEIFGSTETGQLAMRRPAQQAEWEAYDGITLRQQGGVTTATGGHLEGAQILNDAVDILSPTRFRLLDRHANMVNIAGKRSSLGFLNHTLMQVPGVQDAAFWLPPDHGQAAVTRLLAFAVAPGLHADAIRQALRGHLDPAFLPRPLILLPSLPRDGNGKLSQRALQELAATHVPTRYGPAP